MLGDLPVDKTMPTPTIGVCLQLMEEYNMLPNIREHSLVVARVAGTVLDKLSRSTEPLVLPKKELVIAGALLHDIAKTGCLKDGGDHAEIGWQICFDLGYGEIAEIVREHVRLFSYAEDDYIRGIFPAKEIVFYADKRVLHNQIVDLPTRLEYILEKYGNNDTDRHRIINRNFQKCRNLEEWLCKKAGCASEYLVYG